MDQDWTRDGTLGWHQALTKENGGGPKSGTLVGPRAGPSNKQLTWQRTTKQSFNVSTTQIAGLTCPWQDYGQSLAQPDPQVIQVNANPSKPMRADG
eukprot:2909883-Ditylum_brightwellii.AAC.1